MITDKQIRALRERSIAAGDYRTADICQRALTDDTVDQDGNAIPFADWTREQARRVRGSARDRRGVAEASQLACIRQFTQCA